MDIHRQYPEFRWPACLGGGGDVVVNVLIAVYPEFSSCQTSVFLALSSLCRVTYLHIYPGRVPHRDMVCVFSQCFLF